MGDWVPASYQVGAINAPTAAERARMFESAASHGGNEPLTIGVSPRRNTAAAADRETMAAQQQVVEAVEAVEAVVVKEQQPMATKSRFDPVTEEDVTV